MKGVVFSCLIVLMVSVGLGPAHEDHTRSKNELQDGMERVRIKKGETWRSQRTIIDNKDYLEYELDCPHYKRIVVTKVIFLNEQGECAFPGRESCGCTMPATNLVKTQCDGQHRCRVRLEQKFFEHPCITLNNQIHRTRVWRTCKDDRGDGTITRFACERSRMIMDCPNGQDMRIVSAVWGRHTKDKCNPRLMNDYITRFDPGCRLDLTELLQHHCFGKERCETTATNEFLGGLDPCVGNYKYLEVKYRCQPSVLDLVKEALTKQSDN